MTNIPDEIVDYNILTRLPVESLLRFKCVSKYWYSLITSSAFINLHQLYGQANLIIASGFNRNLEPGHYLLCADLDSAHFINERELDFGVKKKRWNDIIGCSNGLICYITGSSLGLCNPLTRERRSLIHAPKISPNSKYYGTLRVYGFGYDSIHRDYKIVKFSVFLYKLRVDEPEIGYIQVYSFSWNSWKNKKVAQASVLGCEDRGVVINNTLHWRSSSKLMNNVNNYHSKILTFDLHNEDFGEIAFPITFDGALPSSIELMECRGCLNTTVDYGGDVSIWVMKEYGIVESWTKICQMNPTQIFGGPIRVVTYRLSQEDAGEVLFLRLIGNELVWYNLKHKTTIKIILPEKGTYTGKQWECTASLASIDSSFD